jgi:hypothetical protein
MIECVSGRCYCLDTTYEQSSVDRSDTVLEFSVEKVAETSVLSQIGGLDFVKVASKGESVETEARGPEPDGKFEGIEIAPKARQIAKGKSSEYVNLTRALAKGSKAVWSVENIFRERRLLLPPTGKENPRLRAFPCLQLQRALKEDTHLPRTFEFDHFPPIFVDLDLFLYLDGLFAVSDCDQQKGADGYWNRIPLCRRPSPRIDELLWSKDNENHNSAAGLEYRGENKNVP